VASRADFIPRDAGNYRPQTLGHIQGTGDSGTVYEDDVSIDAVRAEYFV
jgi:hypothetical protein